MFASMNLVILRIVLGMLLLCPARNARDLAYRFDLAEAISSATDDPHEQDILTRIAWFESAYRSDVAACGVRGDRGRSLGVFQVQPRSPTERRNACGNLAQQADLALRFMHDSAEACPGNVGADTLAMYVSGSCTRGLVQARHRWGQD